jgi:hypothetical protein
MGRVKQYFDEISADPEEKDPEEEEQSGTDLPEWIPGGMLAQIPESTLYEEYLEQCCLPGARPYGCRKYFGIKTKTKYIGTLQRGKWLTDLYEDTEGDYWHSKRVRVGRWIITAFECFRGRRDLDSPHEAHTGIPSDWDKMIDEYGEVPANWERLPEEKRVDGDEDHSSNVA